MLDPDAVLADPVCIAFDVSPDRHSIDRGGGPERERAVMVEVIAREAGTGWLAERLVELYRRMRWRRSSVTGIGPAAAIARKADEAGIKVRLLDSRRLREGVRDVRDTVGERTLRHIGQDELDSALVWCLAQRVAPVFRNPTLCDNSLHT